MRQIKSNDGKIGWLMPDGRKVLFHKPLNCKHWIRLWVKYKGRG